MGFWEAFAVCRQGDAENVSSVFLVRTGIASHVPELITVTDAVVAEVGAWQARPLEPMYPVVFFDAIHDRFVHAVDQFVARHHLPKIPFESGQDKDALVAATARASTLARAS
jgi:hypothetical protein